MIPCRRRIGFVRPVRAFQWSRITSGIVAWRLRASAYRLSYCLLGIVRFTFTDGSDRFEWRPAGRTTCCHGRRVYAPACSRTLGAFPDLRREEHHDEDSDQPGDRRSDAGPRHSIRTPGSDGGHDDRENAEDKPDIDHHRFIMDAPDVSNLRRGMPLERARAPQERRSLSSPATRLD